MQMKSIVLAAALLVLIGGCARDNAGQSNVRQGAATTPPNGNSASTARSQAENALGDTLKNNGKLSPDYFKSRLHPRMTREEAAAQFGNNYVVISRQESSDSKWRFDYGDTGYQFQNTQKDRPDIDGLRKGMLHAQLILTWDPKTDLTSKAELYYRVSDQNANRQVNVYTVPDTGETSEGRVG